MTNAPLIISVHDVAPGTVDAARRWTGWLDERGVPSTLLAVPGPWGATGLASDADTLDWLWVRQGGGDEIGLHGWCHRTEGRDRTWRGRVGRCIARGAEEFWSIDSREAARRVRAGLDVLRKADLRVSGFTPPGWLIGSHARHAVRTCGLRYVADHRGAVDVHRGRAVRAPALSHRPGGFGERTGAVAMETVVRRRVRQGVAIRIAMHPADLSRPGLAETTMRCVDLALDAGATPMTYATALGITPAEQIDTRHTGTSVNR